MNTSELAKEIINELYKQNSSFIGYFIGYLILNVFIVVIASYFGAYLKNKGQERQRKEDHKEITDRLVETTKEVETLKKELDRVDWVKREWTSIRIKKIEELVTAALKCEEYLGGQSKNAINEIYDGRNYMLFEAMIVAAELYLPELHIECIEYVQSARQIDLHISKYCGEIIRETNIEEKEKFKNMLHDDQKYSDFLYKRKILIAKSATLLETLMKS